MATTVDTSNEIDVIGSSNNLAHVDNNSRSPSPAADALSLLDEPIDMQPNMISNNDISHVSDNMHNISNNSSSVITSTPITQRGLNSTEVTDLVCDSVNISYNRNKTEDSFQSGSHSRTDSPATYHSMGSAGSVHNSEGDNVSMTSSGTFTDISHRVKTSILGFEVMEDRSRFTVFKVQVKPSAHESWFIFRRYNDFVRLNERLMVHFPSFRLALPSKRWIGDNFDSSFLKSRQRGLQAFLNNVMGHAEVSHCGLVKTFLCLDDPPGEHESLEESKALCESMEEEMYHLQKEMEEKDARISLLEEELELQRLEIENLKKTVKYERTMKRRPSNQSLVSTSEHSTLTEADQQRYAQSKNSKENSPFKKSPSRDKMLSDLTSSSPTITETIEESTSTDSNTLDSSTKQKFVKTKSDTFKNSTKVIKSVKSDSAVSSEFRGTLKGNKSSEHEES